jgi:hypothetical protein
MTGENISLINARELPGSSAESSAGQSAEQLEESVEEVETENAEPERVDEE